MIAKGHRVKKPKKAPKNRGGKSEQRRFSFMKGKKGRSLIRGQRSFNFMKDKRLIKPFPRLDPVPSGIHLTGFERLFQLKEKKRVMEKVNGKMVPKEAMETKLIGEIWRGDHIEVYHLIEGNRNPRAKIDAGQILPVHKIPKEIQGLAKGVSAEHIKQANVVIEKGYGRGHGPVPWFRESFGAHTLNALEQMARKQGIKMLIDHIKPKEIEGIKMAKLAGYKHYKKTNYWYKSIK